MHFQNPANGYVEEVSDCWLFTLLFGSFYFAYKGMWGHCLISAFLAIATMGLSWLIYPFFAKEMVRKHYLRNGWNEITVERYPLNEPQNHLWKTSNKDKRIVLLPPRTGRNT